MDDFRFPFSAVDPSETEESWRSCRKYLTGRHGHVVDDIFANYRLSHGYSLLDGIGLSQDGYLSMAPADRDKHQYKKNDSSDNVPNLHLTLLFDVGAGTKP
jgi:hypothetical protein